MTRTRGTEKRRRGTVVLAQYFGNFREFVEGGDVVQPAVEPEVIVFEEEVAQIEHQVLEGREGVGLEDPKKTLDTTRGIW